MSALSASSLINEFVSDDFLIRILHSESSWGSIHLFKKLNISISVIRAILDSDDLSESAIFIIYVIIETIVPLYYKMRLEW